MKDEYLDPRWQKIRLKIMERDGFACKVCGEKTATLHVHHLKYEKGKKIWDVNDDDLETLCEKCHKNIEDLISRVRENSIPILKQSSDIIDSTIDASKDSFLEPGDQDQFKSIWFLNSIRNISCLWNFCR